VEDAGEDVVNSEENDIDPGLLNTVLNISPEVSKNVPNISLTTSFDLLYFF
jgi:hypothetical protein